MLNFMVLLAVLVSCSTFKASPTVAQEELREASLCGFKIEYGRWNGSFSGLASDFKEKELYPVRGQVFNYSAGGYAEHTTSKKVFAPKELEGLTVKVELVTSRDIGWDDHEEWRVKLSLLDSKTAKFITGPVEAALIRDLHKIYLPSEASPELSLTHEISGYPLRIAFNCNKF